LPISARPSCNFAAAEDALGAMLLGNLLENKEMAALVGRFAQMWVLELYRFSTQTFGIPPF